MTLEAALVLTGAGVWLAVIGVAGGYTGVLIGRGLVALWRRFGKRTRPAGLPGITVRGRCWACGRTEEVRAVAKDPEAALEVLWAELRVRGWHTGRTRLACHKCAPATILSDVNHG
ncbi:hypothetical protein ACH47B_06715 [Rhodococcus sp. NPDC019627]|uniref:hypothetical protein n=1 Tax=unclassified Rhodococcus (in: high G+C Gram-positive bacteria) TaxID=192944 RepID=UPI00379424D3